MRHYLETNLTRPIRMVAYEPSKLAVVIYPWQFLIKRYPPVVTCITLYNSFTYGILYLLFGAVPIVFEQGKGWTPVEASLVRRFPSVLTTALTWSFPSPFWLFLQELSLRQHSISLTRSMCLGPTLTSTADLQNPRCDCHR